MQFTENFYFRFLIKYHPLRLAAIQNDVFKNLSNRAKVFNSLLESGKLHNLTLISEKSDIIVRLMDTAVILMEGGTENDLKALDVKSQVDSEICENTTKDGKIDLPLCYNNGNVVDKSTDDNLSHDQEVIYTYS